MKPSIVSRLSMRTLLLAAGVVALMVGIACGGAQEPAPAAQQQQAPAAQQQQQAAPAATDAPAAMQPTNTPIPQAVAATVRPTNTPAPTAVPQVAATPTPSAGPKYGGTMIMSAYADTKDWDPLGSGSLSSVISYSQLYNQIVQFDPVDTAAITGDLAESWDVSADGLTYTFHLRNDMQWTDGTEITSADVITTMRRYANPCNGTGRSGLWRNYGVRMEVVDKAGGNCTPTNQDDVLRAIDDKTVEFNLQFASGTFIKFLAIDYAKVLPGHQLDSDPNCEIRDAANPCFLNLGENIIDRGTTSGPFILEEYQVGDFYKVNKNENYFKDGLPYVDRIEHYIFPGTAKDRLIAQFEARQIDMTNGGFDNLSPTQKLQVSESTNGEYVPHPIPAGTNWGLMLNIKKPQFQDHRVRQAINLTVDRQEIDERVFDNTSGSYCPLMGLAHSNEECNSWPGIRPKNTAEGQQDLADAKALMAEAGVADGFEVQYTVRQVGNYPDQCQVVKQQLQDNLGITGDIETLPSAAGYAKYGTSRAADSAGDWEISCQGEGMVVYDLDAIYGGVYREGGTRNYTNWSNPKLEDWFEQQKVELDPNARREINKEAELWLQSFEDNHWVTMQLGGLLWMVHRDVKGFNAPQTVQYQFKYEDVWLDR